MGCAFFDYAYDGKKAPRCDGDYGLPVHVDASIHAVFNVGNLAPRISKLKGITRLVDKEVTEYVTPSKASCFLFNTFKWCGDRRRVRARYS